MLKFITKNILISLINILVLVSITFLLFDILPSDPIKVRLGFRYNEKDAKVLREKYQLDKPLFYRFLVYIYNIFSGDFGKSIILGYDVLDLIKIKAPKSLKLILISFIFSLPFVPLGFILGYFNKGIAIERFLFFIAIIPVFIIASLIIFISIIFFKVSLTSEKLNFIDYIIPSLVLSIFPSFIIFKTIRENTQKISNKLFITAHKAFGFSEKDIILKFIPKNISAPAIALISNLSLYYLSTIYVVEFAFGINGIGELAVSSALNYDFPVVIGVAILVSIIYNLINILTKVLIAITNKAYIYEISKL
jgi:peptide/nickel transport system permease protein